MAGMRPFLMLFAAAPVQLVGDHQLRLPESFVSGMRMHLRQWHGPVIAVMRQDHGAALDLAPVYARGDLGFEVRVLADDEPLENALSDGPGLVLASVDIAEQLGLGAAARARGLAVIYGTEHAPDGLLQRALSDQGRGILRRFWSLGWQYRQEAARRHALRKADGIQLNGFPAAVHYSSLNRNPLRYLDNRMRKSMLATTRDMAARRARHSAMDPVRLIHVGTLEPDSGAQDLLPLASQLRAMNVPFTLSIFGYGSLSPMIHAQIDAQGLGDHVTLSHPQSFSNELVVQMRHQGDVFISCHRHSDPLSSYIEAMGCGLPVLGFENQMLSPLLRRSAGGWGIAAARLPDMARQIAILSRERGQIMHRAEAGLNYARRHHAEAEFAIRMEHINRIYAEHSTVALAFASRPARHVRAES